MTAAVIVVAVALLLAGLARRRRARRLEQARVRLTRAQAEAAAHERAQGLALEAQARLAIAQWQRCRARPRQASPRMWFVPGGRDGMTGRAANTFDIADRDLEVGQIFRWPCGAGAQSWRVTEILDPHVDDVIQRVRAVPAETGAVQ